MSNKKEFTEATKPDAAIDTARLLGVRAYSEEELKQWWVAKCELCGWEGLSRDVQGGSQIADTGDYDDCYCPKCYENDIWQPVIDLDDFQA